MSRARSAPTREQIRVDDLVTLPLPGLDHPTRVEFTQDSNAVTYLAPDPGSNTRSLWRQDLESGTRTLLASVDLTASRALTREEELRLQRRRELGSGITEYHRAEDADLIVAIHRGRCLVSQDGSLAVEMPDIRVAEAVYPDPGGRRIAWAAWGELWLAELAGGAHRRLSQDGEPGVSNGLEDYLAAEELDRFEGAWWSAAGTEILFTHVDERRIPLFMTGTGRSASGTMLREEYRYPFAGGPNPRTTLRLAAMALSRPGGAASARWMAGRGAAPRPAEPALVSRGGVGSRDRALGRAPAAVGERRQRHTHSVRRSRRARNRDEGPSSSRAARPPTARRVAA